MTRKELRRTGQFVALDEQGHPHTVVEYTYFLHVGTLLDADQWAPGLMAYKLVNGDHCNFDEDTGVLEVVRTGAKLRRA